MTADAATAARLVSEPTRERETYKYDPSLLTSIKYNDNGVPIPSSELVTSHDTVLTALAQLGACRLKTARSLLSLFDKNYQYIVAEATPTIPLVPGLRHEDRNEDLWLCGTAIPRQHGVCEHTLCVLDPITVDGDSSDPAKLPLALVSDLTSDPRFSCKPYCRPGTPARFYAAVPVRTHRGINIGVYCVIDTEPRDVSEWDAECTALMRNISHAIMDHLELRRFSHIHGRSGRMNRGLGSFVEGKEILSGRYDPAGPALADNDEADSESTPVWPPVQSLKPVRPVEQNTSREARSTATNHRRRASSTDVVMRDRTPSPSGPEPTIDMSSVHSPPSMGRSSGDTEPDKPIRGYSIPNLPRPNAVHGIFSRAARIIKESIEVDGFLFLDASRHSFGAAPATPPLDDTDVNGFRFESQSPPASSSDELTSGAKTGTRCSGPEPQCRVLGFSSSELSNDAGQGIHDPGLHATVPQAFLSKLLKRYPLGKIFNFDEDGDIQSSDSSGDERKSPALMLSRGGDEDSGTEGGYIKSRRQRSPRKRRSEGGTILGIFPGARSVAFVPVWDARKERWFAGGFAYTCNTTRIFTIEGELSYLRAFGMLSIEETFRLEAQLADRAKSDVLNSLSHELRSPLHGIVLGVELFSDTKLDVYQANIMHTLETCSRTLLDTVDHLLDFSKINNYMTTMKTPRRSSGARGLRQGSNGTIEAGMKSLSSQVRLDILVEEVTESVFAGFNFQQISLSQLVQQRSATHADVRANRRLDSMRAMEDLGPGLTETGELRLDFGRVSVFLDVHPACSWVFQTQPGAVRRIVMNLFGNALKYTRNGIIVVSLRQDDHAGRRGGKMNMVNITVKDTGRGISEDYLRHELFRPFSQEDHLAPGTGLGLSLVKQITSQLMGGISVDSRVGIGTTVTVSLPLLPVLPSGGADVAESTDGEADFVRALSDLKGLVIHLIGFIGSNYEEELRGAGEAGYDNFTPIESICRGWFQMEVISDKSTQTQVPDVVLCLDEAPVMLTTNGEPLYAIPTVVICANALISYQRSTSVKLTKPPRIIEFISQPIGPRKLAKALSLTMRRRRNCDASNPISEESSPLSSTSPSVAGLTPGLVVSLDQAGAQVKQPISAHTFFADTESARLQSPPAPPELLLPTASSPPLPQEQLPVFLLVDDNDINLKILSCYTKKIGREYATATNGLEAIQTFCTFPGRYKCVFMDISMPIMDGFEATRRIRTFEREKGLQPASIFALSGLASANAQQEALDSGIDLFLTKPVKLKELGSILEARGFL